MEPPEAIGLFELTTSPVTVLSGETGNSWPLACDNIHSSPKEMQIFEIIDSYDSCVRVKDPGPFSMTLPWSQKNTFSRKKNYKGLLQEKAKKLFRWAFSREKFDSPSPGKNKFPRPFSRKKI